MNTGYQLEMANSKMSEMRHEADHAALVAELKGLKNEREISTWRKLMGQSLIKLGQRLIPAPLAQ